LTKPKNSFPVVFIRLSAAPEGLMCARDSNKAIFWMDDFISFPKGEVTVVEMDNPRSFLENPHIIGKAAWKRSYNLQKSGNEEPSSSSAICDKCALAILEAYGCTKDKSVVLAIGAIRSGYNLILFDANLDRDHFYPSVFHTPSKSLQEFRIRYWSGSYEMLFGGKL
jgi:hypothetical protein